MKFHFYGQPTFTELPKSTTIQDLRELARFNRIIKNYAKMITIEKHLGQLQEPRQSENPNHQGGRETTELISLNGFTE